MAVSKIRNSSRNMLFASINFLIQTVLKFAARTVFLRFLSVEYLGVNNLFVNVLTVLSLAELGVGQAIVYSLYKPVAEGNKEKVLTLINAYKKLYSIIGLIILVLGLAIMPALPFLIEGTPPEGVNLYIVYSIFLGNTVLGYFRAHRRAMLFADQKQSIESQVGSVQIILLNVIQIIIVAVWQNFYAYVAMLPLFTLLDAIAIYTITNKMYPELNKKAKPLEPSERKEITKNAMAMLSHKVGNVLVFSTDSIIISAFLGAAALGYYSNYYLIAATLASFITITINALKGSIGNLVAVEKAERIHKIFGALNIFAMWATGFCLIGMICLYQDFMTVWLGKDYLLPFWVMVALAFRSFFNVSKMMPVAFKDAAGLFYKDRFVPLIEVVINLGLDILLVVLLKPYGLGLMGVLIATIISLAVTRIWVTPVLLYKYLFKRSPIPYFIKYILVLLISIAVCALTYYLGSFINVTNVGTLILKILFVLVFSNIVFIGILFLMFFKTAEFEYVKEVFKRLKSKLLRQKPAAAQTESGMAASRTEEERQEEAAKKETEEKREEEENDGRF